MALAAKYVVTGAAVTTSVAQLYTVPTTYVRDLVITNAGASAIYVGLSTDGTVATSAASMRILSGNSLLQEGQAPPGAVLSALTGAGTSAISVGYASVSAFS